MSARIFYQEDCNLSLLDGKTIAIIGYGSQGHAHALNLKESGCDVIIGLYEGSRSWKRAEEQGFKVYTAAEAAKKADIIMILINDEKQADMYKKDMYFVYGYYNENGELAGYAFFINDRTKDTVLLDYFAIVPEKRSSGIGSEFLGKIKEKIADSGNRLILEVENPEYAEDGPAKDYMIKRIGFYKKNDMNLSGVSCNFYDNEYRILYAGEFMDDEEVYNRTHSVYLDFMGEELDSRCVFH